jgi:multidrug efflux pump subunit AcrB
VYLPVLKQGGDANTIAVVNGVKRVVSKLLDVPKQLVTQVVFDQSVFVRNAIENLIHEGAIGLVLTGVMILVFWAACGPRWRCFFPFRFRRWRRSSRWRWAAAPSTP